MDCCFSDEEVEQGDKRLNRLALGTAQFGLDYGVANKLGQVSLNEVDAILQHARASGMNVLDTAIAYGDSERRLGEIGVQDWQVVSKLPTIPNDCGDVAQWVADAVHDSLERLKVTSIYGLLLHRPQQLLEADGDKLYRSLQQLKNDGLVQNIGISIYDPIELDALYDRFSFDIIQAPFNLLDHRMVESGWMDKLSQCGTEIHVRSIFLQGLLLMSSNDRPEKFNRWQPLWNRWQEWMGAAKCTPLQACLRHVLAQPQIDRIIIGIDNLNQFKEVLEAVDGRIPHVPPELYCSDLDLINPARWSALS